MNITRPVHGFFSTLSHGRDGGETVAIQRAFKRSPAELIGPASTFFSLNGKWFEWKEFRSVLRRSVGRGKKEKKNRKKKRRKKRKGACIFRGREEEFGSRRRGKQRLFLRGRTFSSSLGRFSRSAVKRYDDRSSSSSRKREKKKKKQERNRGRDAGDNDTVFLAFR